MPRTRKVIQFFIVVYIVRPSINRIHHRGIIKLYGNIAELVGIPMCSVHNTVREILWTRPFGNHEFLYESGRERARIGDH